MNMKRSDLHASVFFAATAAAAAAAAATCSICSVADCKNLQAPTSSPRYEPSNKAAHVSGVFSQAGVGECDVPPEETGAGVWAARFLFFLLERNYWEEISTKRDPTSLPGKKKKNPFGLMHKEVKGIVGFEQTSTQSSAVFFFGSRSEAKI